MAKRGRPRKAGARYADGKLRKPTLQQLKDFEAARYRENMAQAAAQPHRRGARDPLSPLLENALGRFCEQHRLRREIYDAGTEWGDTFRRWCAAKGVPNPKSRGPMGSGLGPSDETVERWERKLDRVRARLEHSGKFAYLGARSLCLDCEDIPHLHAADAILGLEIVAQELGQWDMGRRAFPERAA